MVSKQRGCENDFFWCVCVNYSIKVIRCYHLHTLMPFHPFSLPRNAKEASLKTVHTVFIYITETVTRAGQVTERD